MIINNYELRSKGLTLEAVEIALDNTTLLILSGYGAFAMCGALDVGIYNSAKMIKRNVVCFKAVGVTSIEELYHSLITDSSASAKKLGIESGMTVEEAFEKMAFNQNNS